MPSKCLDQTRVEVRHVFDKRRWRLYEGQTRRSRATGWLLQQAGRNHCAFLLAN